MKNKPVIQTRRAVLEIPGSESADLMLRYYLENRSHLSPWEPECADKYDAPEYWQGVLRKNNESFRAGTAFRFSAFNYTHTEIIAVCNFTNVVYGVFQACHLGFSIAEKYQGQGLMSEILTASLNYVYDVVGLHRVMANYLPSNVRSEKILNRLGFEKEGYAKSYLKIAGEWEDHILTSKVNE